MSDLDNLDNLHDAPVEDAPVEDAPVEDAPVEDAPVEDAPVEDAPSLDEVVDNIKNMLQEDRSSVLGVDARMVELEKKLKVILEVLVDQKLFRYYNGGGWSKLDRMNKGLDYE